jgi:very-short-patch-repair endonuclease
VRDPDEKSHDIEAKSQGHRRADAEIAQLADRQHGVVSTAQLMSMGLGSGAIEHRVSCGRLHRVHRGVYAVGRATLTPAGHRMAAVLSCGRDALISHRTAAAVWGLLATDQTMIDVTILRSGVRSRPPIRIHSTGILHPTDIAVVDGIPVTSIPRTLLDLAARLRPDVLLRAVEQAVRLNLFDLAAVDAAIGRSPRREGVPRLRQVLADYREPPVTRSELERSFLALVEQSGLPRPRVNTTVASLEVDFFWPGSRLVVELDGRAYHTSPRAFERDRRRDAILLRAGCRVLRITFRRLQDDPGGVIEDIRALIDRAA